MVSMAKVEESGKGWIVKVDWGMFTTTYGPYRWRWVARLVAWMEDGRH